MAQAALAAAIAARLGRGDEPVQAARGAHARAVIGHSQRSVSQTQAVHGSLSVGTGRGQSTMVTRLAGAPHVMRER